MNLGDRFRDSSYRLNALVTQKHWRIQIWRRFYRWGCRSEQFPSLGLLPTTAQLAKEEVPTEIERVQAVASGWFEEVMEECRDVSWWFSREGNRIILLDYQTGLTPEEPL